MSMADQELRKLEIERRETANSIPFGSFPTRREHPPQPGLILQRQFNDCNICTIAMATGRSYEEVAEAAIKTKSWNPDNGGMGSDQATFKALGYVQEYKDGQYTDKTTVFSGHLPYGIDPAFYAKLFLGREALFSVPSRNKKGGYHSVYYNGYEVLDPSTRNIYTQLAELRPTYATYFPHLPHSAANKLIGNALAGDLSSLEIA